MRPLPILLAVIAIGAAALVLVQLVVGARTGPLPLVSVFEIHLLAVATVAALLALLGSFGGGRGRAWLRLVLVAVVVLGVVRLGDELWSPDPAPDPSARDAFSVLTWNLQEDSKRADDVIAGIADVDADVVALQELTPDIAAAIEADPGLVERYPYRILEPQRPTGLGLLSARPLLVRGLDDEARVLRAGLLLLEGTTVEVLVVHPQRPTYTTAGSIPVSLDTRARDKELARIVELVEGLEDPASALVLGDLNASPTEPGRAALQAALTDAHRSAGAGPGFTWRVAPLEALDLALIRIDAVLAGDRLRPIRAEVDCTIRGDHCRVQVGFLVPAPESDEAD